MKNKKTVLLFALSLGLLACNNQGKDSVEKADSANEEKREMDTSVNTPATATITTDGESSSFLVKAANAEMAEVQLGELAQQKAVNPKVKEFGAMMQHDHSAANDQVKELAARRNVTLPDSVGDAEKKDYNALNKKSGADFDKAFIKNMISDHNSAIDLFEKCADKSKDADVKTFIDNTLPKLRNHLDSAKAIQKILK